MTKIRRILPALLAASIATPAFAGPDGGISTPMLSRCAGKAGLETRQSDAAFGLLALDGAPWLSIERTDEAVGIQPIMTTVTGTGSRYRRNGTSVPFRFTFMPRMFRFCANTRSVSRSPIMALRSGSNPCSRT